MSEYPKVIQVGAVKVTVASAAEEVRWRKPHTPPAAVPQSDPPSEPAVEHVEEPKKPKGGKKK